MNILTWSYVFLLYILFSRGILFKSYNYLHALVFSIILYLTFDIVNHTREYLIDDKVEVDRTGVEDLVGNLEQQINDGILKVDINKEIHWLPQGYDIDFLYKNFYQEERTDAFFSYIAPHPPRRSNTEQYTSFLSQKFNIPLIRKDLTKLHSNQWHNFISLFSKSTFCINLDPEPQFGQQGIQSSILGVINIGGVNDSHFNLWPKTCHNNLNQLTDFIEKCLDNPEYRFTIMQESFEKASQIYSFEAVRNKFIQITT